MRKSRFVLTMCENESTSEFNWFFFYWPSVWDQKFNLKDLLHAQNTCPPLFCLLYTYNKVIDKYNIKELGWDILELWLVEQCQMLFLILSSVSSKPCLVSLFKKSVFPEGALASSKYEIRCKQFIYLWIFSTIPNHVHI